MWIKKLRHPSYTNIFDYNLGNKNLWGTETLLGDWDGEYLFIAKDFYPSSYIEERIGTVANPYCHKPGIPTNNNLIKTLRYFRNIDEESTTTDCNFLYISACFLLRNDGVVRGALPDEQAALAISAPVVLFTMEKMPNLRYVVAMGRQAAASIEAGALEPAIRARNLAYFQVSHPSYAMSDAARFSEWEPIFRKRGRSGRARV